MRAEDIALLGLDDEFEDEDEDDELELLGDDDDDDEDDDLLGAARRIRRGRGGGRKGRMVRKLARGFIQGRKAKRRAIRGALKQPLPGVSGRGTPRVFPLGFPALQFVNAGATSLQTQTNPQRPFKGNRLVITVRASAGATGLLVTLNTFSVGENSQKVSSDPLPAEMFQANAFDVPLAISPAEPGVLITVVYAISAAPGVGETVDVGTGIIGVTLD